MIRVSQLAGKMVRTANGKNLGRVVEIRATGSEIHTLICGPKGLLQQLAAFRTGHRVKWEQVRKITPREIICDER